MKLNLNVAVKRLEQNGVNSSFYDHFLCNKEAGLRKVLGYLQPVRWLALKCSHKCPVTNNWQ